MSFGRDLYKTKLCNLYQRGNCPRQSCSFAHGEAELRRFGSSAFNGRRDFRGGDLRERLQRRHSPHNKRTSPGRETRGRQDRRQSLSRSPVRGRSSRSASPASSGPQKREKKRPRHDEPLGNLSDGSGEPKDQTNWANGSVEKRTKSQSPDPLELLEDELQDVDVEIETLRDSLVQFQSSVEEKTKDIDNLSAKNLELDLRLHKEHEEYKRCSSKLKKFLKLYLRCSRAQEEVKKTQARLQKLVDDLPSCENQRFPQVGEDSDVVIVSDGEANLVVHGPPTVLAAVKDGDKEGLSYQKIYPLQTKSKLPKSSRPEVAENGLNKEAMNGIERDRVTAPLGRSVVAAEKGRMPPIVSEEMISKVRSWDSSVVLPSTGLAAHAEDDLVENDDEKQPSTDVKSDEKTPSESLKVLPLVIISSQVPSSNLPKVSSIAPTQYAQYEGDDEDVDVEEMEDNADND